MISSRYTYPSRRQRTFHEPTSELSFKEVGDHLGHRDPDSTRIYARVNLTMLRQVAFDALGGLT